MPVEKYSYGLKWLKAVFYVLVVSFALVSVEALFFHWRASWRTVEIIDLAKPQKLSISPRLPFLGPTDLEIDISGRFKGMVVFRVREGIGISTEISADGEFSKNFYSGDWYSPCSLEYEPVVIIGKQDPSAKIIVRYRLY